MKKSRTMSLVLTGVLAIAIVPVVIHAAGYQKNWSCPQGVPPFFAEKYDTDHDGTLSAAEEKAAMEAFMKKYDTDKDGSLSREEHQAVRDAMHKVFFDKGDTNKDGVLSREEFTKISQYGPRGFGGPRPSKGRGCGPCW